MTEIVLGTVLFTLIVLILTLLVIGARAVLLAAVPVTITVNGTRNVTGTTGEKLLSVLLDAGIPVPSACAGLGTCGLCRVTLPDSDDKPLPTETARLERREIAQGVRLACQVVVRNPLSVEVHEGILAAEEWMCRVVSNTMLAPLIKELVLETPESQEFKFRAGAFVQITSPPYELAFTDIDVGEAQKPLWGKLGWHGLRAQSGAPVSRAYSIANTPSDAGRIVLNIRLALPPPGAETGALPGIVSSYLFGLKPGDTVSVAGPFGDFYARNTDREMVVIGGGVGMAPLRAIIFDQMQRIGSKRKISFWYGARSLADLFYREEFDALAEQHENFTWTVALSEPSPQDDWKGPVGFIHDMVFNSHLRNHKSPESCEYYLCGPPLMIQAVEAMLGDVGVESDAIFNDDFGE